MKPSVDRDADAELQRSTESNPQESNENEADADTERTFTQAQAEADAAAAEAEAATECAECSECLECKPFVGRPLYESTQSRPGSTTSLYWEVASPCDECVLPFREPAPPSASDSTSTSVQSAPSN